MILYFDANLVALIPYYQVYLVYINLKGRVQPRSHQLRQSRLLHQKENFPSDDI